MPIGHLNDAQLNYSTTEKEFLVVVFTLEKFQSYLIGSQITVYTERSSKIFVDKEGCEGKPDKMGIATSGI